MSCTVPPWSRERDEEQSYDYTAKKSVYTAQEQRRPILISRVPPDILMVSNGFHRIKRSASPQKGSTQSISPSIQPTHREEYNDYEMLNQKRRCV